METVSWGVLTSLHLFVNPRAQIPMPISTQSVCEHWTVRLGHAFQHSQKNQLFVFFFAHWTDFQWNTSQIWVCENRSMCIQNKLVINIWSRLDVCACVCECAHEPIFYGNFSKPNLILWVHTFPCMLSKWICCRYANMNGLYKTMR